MRDKRNYMETLKNITYGKRFIIPLYQRNYKWGYKEIIKLMADFIKIYKEKEEQKDKKKIKNKSIGLLTLYKDENNYYVIDGQQRLITLQIIFSVLIKGEGEDYPIELKFERDEDNRCRHDAVYKDTENCNTEIDRIKRNKKLIEEILSLSEIGKEFEEKLNEASKEERQFFTNDEIKSFISKIDRENFKEFLLKNCTMLCTYIDKKPIDEFMNLNAYKTKFSICDYVRANMISLNSFYRDELENRNAYLAGALDKHSYKSAIAHLYNDILKLLYDENNIFEYLLVKKMDLNPDDSSESRINFLFVDRKTVEDRKQGYHSDSINENMEYWIKMILKLACIKRILMQLKEERDNNNFSSLKKISDYQELKKKNFLRFNIMEIDKEYDEINTLTLAELLKEKSNVVSILLSDLDCSTDQRLANRYLESFVESSKERKTNIAEEYIFEPEKEIIQLYTMSKEKLFEEIQGIGKHIINRYIIEDRRNKNVKISIAPLINLDDTENVNFGGDLTLDESNEISVEELFKNNITIPVIQRDYCMGYQINENNDGNFLEFLLDDFVKFRKSGEEAKKTFKTVISTIVIAVEKKREEKGNVYIFDGQQRTYTLYIILKYLYDKLGKSKNFDDQYGNYKFIGRDNGVGNSPYSDKAEKNLEVILGKVLEEKENILDDEKNSKIIWWKMLKCEETPKDILEKDLEKKLIAYLKHKIKFKVQIVKGISDAEQFFMDINGGVQLEKYEIFKSILYNHLLGFKSGEDIIRKIENEWLSYFYNWRNTIYGINNQDEPNEEEILEMRFIEYICRFIYNKNSENKNDLWKEDDVFDVYTSKSEIVAKESKYITRLVPEDINEFVKIMEKIGKDISEIVKKHETEEKMGNLGGMLREGKISLTNEKRSYKRSSKIYVGQSNGLDKDIRFINFILSDEPEKKEIEGAEVLHSFIWSLCELNREIYKKICEKTDKEVMDRDKEIINTYDNDIILQKYFENKLNPENRLSIPEEYLGKKRPLFILAGYKIGLIQIEETSSQEIPFYYAWKEIKNWPENNILKYMEISFIYNQGNEKNKDIGNYFALVGKQYKGDTFVKYIENLKGIKDISLKYENKNEIYYWEISDNNATFEMNRLDAYILKSNNALHFLGISKESLSKAVNSKSVD